MAGMNPLVIDAFHYYRRLVGSRADPRRGRAADPLDEIPKTANLGGYAAAGRHALSRAVRIVLNKRAGTSMGLLGPKSLLKVKQGLSLLEIILRQELAQTRLAMMNSFNTHTATLSEVTKLKPSRPPLPAAQVPQDPVQGKLAPVSWSPNPRAGVEPPRPRRCLRRAVRLRNAFKSYWRRIMPLSATRTIWGPASTKACSAISPKSDFPS